MKILILLIISFSAQAITTAEKIELEKRIRLYHLDKKFNYDERVKIDLEQDIQTQYIAKIEDFLGRCQSGDCLQITNQYLSYQTESKKVCLPYTRCGFYQCMEEKYQCSSVGVNYFSELALPTCQEYTKNISKKRFTQKGYDWIYSVMVCLQKGLIDECELKGNCDKGDRKKTCNYITEFTLKFHPGCYLDSGVGVCKLPLRDKINIWRTVGRFLTARERQEAYKVVLSCIRGDKSRADL